MRGTDRGESILSFSAKRARYKESSTKIRGNGCSGIRQR